MSEIDDLCRVLGGPRLLTEFRSAALVSNGASIQPYSLIFGRCAQDAGKATCLMLTWPGGSASSWSAPHGSRPLPGRGEQVWGAAEWTPAFHPQGCCISLPGPDPGAFKGGQA